MEITKYMKIELKKYRIVKEGSYFDPKEIGDFWIEKHPCRGYLLVNQEIVKLSDLKNALKAFSIT